MCDGDELCVEVGLDVPSHMFYHWGGGVLSEELHADNDSKVFNLEVSLV